MHQSQSFKRAIAAANRIAALSGSALVEPGHLLIGVVFEMAETESGLFDVLGNDPSVIVEEIQRRYPTPTDFVPQQVAMAAASAVFIEDAEDWCSAHRFETAVVESLLLVLLKAEIRDAEMLLGDYVTSRAVETYLVQLPRFAAAFDPPRDAGSFDFLVVWNPDILSPHEYADLICALGDLARASGGIGIRRLDHEGARALVASGAYI